MAESIRRMVGCFPRVVQAYSALARGVGEPIAPALELTADPTVLEGDENVAKLVFDQFE
jgi:hypothetical protein